MPGEAEVHACNFAGNHARPAQCPKMGAFYRVNALIWDLTGVLLGCVNGQHGHGTVEHSCRDFGTADARGHDSKQRCGYPAPF
jgi:hypothetical protein